MIVGSARERRLWNIATYAIAGFFGLTALGPIVWLVLTSLKTEADIVTAQGVVYWPSTLMDKIVGSLVVRVTVRGRARGVTRRCGQVA